MSLRFNIVHPILPSMYADRISIGSRSEYEGGMNKNSWFALLLISQFLKFLFRWIICGTITSLPQLLYLNRDQSPTLATYSWTTLTFLISKTGFKNPTRDLWYGTLSKIIGKGKARLGISWFLNQFRNFLRWMLYGSRYGGAPFLMRKSPLDAMYNSCRRATPAPLIAAKNSNSGICALLWVPRILHRVGRTRSCLLAHSGNKCKIRPSMLLADENSAVLNDSILFSVTKHFRQEIFCTDIDILFFQQPRRNPVCWGNNQHIEVLKTSHLSSFCL